MTRDIAPPTPDQVRAVIENAAERHRRIVEEVCGSEEDRRAAFFRRKEIFAKKNGR